MSYEALVRVRKELVDGLGPWTWIREDTGAWDGPKADWETSHKEAYFKHVKKFGVAIQAGGNQGMYPRLLAQRFKAVYTFEPDPLNFYCLVQNCQEDNIVKMQAALGMKAELIKVNRHNFTNAGMHQVSPGGFIPSLTIDSLNLPELDFMSLDVEGYEEKILRGAERTIEKFRPVIAAENAGGGVVSFLNAFGYKTDCVSKADTVFYVPTE